FAAISGECSASRLSKNAATLCASWPSHTVAFRATAVLIPDTARVHTRHLHRVTGNQHLLPHRLCERCCTARRLREDLRRRRARQGHHADAASRPDRAQTGVAGAAFAEGGLLPATAGRAHFP